VLFRSDAARAAADIVLTQEGLSTIVEGILISRCIFQRMKNFITYRIAATLQLLIFFFIAVLALKPSDFHDEDDDEWPNYFKLPVLMLMLITLLNDGTLISIGYDYVTPSRYPNVWNLPVLFLIASVLGGVALISSLILLYALLDSWHDNNIFHQMGIGSLSYGQITTAMYLKVSVSDFLTLFSARTHDGFFWSSEPSPILLSAACFSLVISTLLACFWPKSVVDDQDVEGLAYNAPYLAIVVWIYCILWWFFQDLAKVGVYYVMGKYNILGINDSTMLGKEGEQRNSSVGDDDENLKTKLLG
jgi:H+-transporting ATPase